MIIDAILQLEELNFLKIWEMHHNQKNCKCVSEMDTQKGRYNMFSLRQVYMTMGHNYCAKGFNEIERLKQRENQIN